MKTETEIQTEINAGYSRIKRLREQIDAISSEITDLERQKFALSASFKVGDVIRLPDHPQWRMTETDNGHHWGFWRQDTFECCRLCGYVRRRDKTSNPCKGRPKLDLRAPEGAGEVRGNL